MKKRNLVFLIIAILAVTCIVFFTSNYTINREWYVGTIYMLMVAFGFAVFGLVLALIFCIKHLFREKRHTNRREEAKATIEEQAVRLEESRSKHAAYSNLVQALSRSYEAIYYVDMDTDCYLEYSAHGADRYRKREFNGENFFDVARRTLSDKVYEEDRHIIAEVFQKEALLARLKQEEIISLTYRIAVDGNPVYHNLKALRIQDEDGLHIVIGISNTDVSVRRRQRLQKAEEQKFTFSSIAQALSNDYESVYYINTRTNQYLAYKSSKPYQTLDIENRGEDFFRDTQNTILKAVYPEDRAKASAAFQKEELLAELEREHRFTVSYRVMVGGHPTYYQFNVAGAPGDDGYHIVVGVSNIDAQVKREKEYDQALQTAIDVANRDGLTGVKNKNAFTHAEALLNKTISSLKQAQFAIVICDVNGLKEINDTLGHKAGDDHIKKASSIICEIFKRSPVYRIGGDEFAVILHGQDFEKREELFRQLRKRVLDNQDTGGVIIASGIASFDPSRDSSAEMVFERADTDMYENKKTLKGGR